MDTIRISLFAMKRGVVLMLAVAAARVDALELSNVFSDHMVLQQDSPVVVWGKAEPGAVVEVEFAGKEESTRADAVGSWSVSLEPLSASFEGRTLMVSSADEKLSFEDVLVGEVWLASGQSNMQWTVEMCADGDILVLGANDPYLRLHKVDYAATETPRFSGKNKWTRDNAESAGAFSSVAYQFARDLRKTLGVPVGVINAAVGGTPCIAWTRSQSFSELPELIERVEEWEAALARYDKDLAAWEFEYAAWKERNWVSDGDYWDHRRLGGPKRPEDAESPKRPAVLANGMIAPIAGYALRGVLWYQGEQDAQWRPDSYDERLRVMIEDWREWWGKDDLPFGIVQLANFMRPAERPTNESWPMVRESQRRLAASDPNVGLIVAIDVGEANDIHPRDKFTVARRLVRWALADIYGKIDLRGGPEVVSAVREGSAIRLYFAEIGKGLHAMDAHELGGFTVSDSRVDPESGTDFYPVEAMIGSKSEVVLTIPEGRHPVRVRYGWQNNPINANLSNEERLPASPFEIWVKE